jgi:hypothetical protein
MPQFEMTSHDVLEFLELTRANDIEIWIDGGWSVDALLKRQTRVHNDLDIALFHAMTPEIASLCWAMIWGIRLIFIRLSLMTRET